MPVLVEVQPLLSAVGEAGAGDGEGEARRGEDGARVGGHVVGALGVVDIGEVGVGREAGEEGFQVAATARCTAAAMSAVPRPRVRNSRVFCSTIVRRL